MPVTLDRGEAERLVHAYSDLILRLSYTYLKSSKSPRPFPLRSMRRPGSSARRSTCARTI